MTNSAVDLDARIATTLRAAAASIVIPPIPTTASLAPAAHPRRRRRAQIVAAVTAAIVLGGYGAAVATGTADGRLAFWKWGGVDPTRATVLTEFPGPSGVTIRAETAPQDGGVTCIAFRVLPQQTRLPFNEGGGCTGSDTDRFNSNAAAVKVQYYADSTPYVLFATSAGQATSAILETTDGPREVSVIDGWIVGWSPADSNATVVAYGSTGQTIGSFHPAQFLGP
ncbi:MAG: hypothetical protein QOI06_2403 [Nocardioidaceae bacterium]|jgi:hypothetical protein|nr:hypothetical protein [Nocardioidaceae bacterium]